MSSPLSEEALEGTAKKFGVSPAPANPPSSLTYKAHLLLQGYHITSPSGYSCVQASEVLVVTGVSECIQQVAWMPQKETLFFCWFHFLWNYGFFLSIYMSNIAGINEQYCLHFLQEDGVIVKPLCRILEILQSIAKAINIYLTANQGVVCLYPPLNLTRVWWTVEADGGEGGGGAETKPSLSSDWVTPQ